MYSGSLRHTLQQTAMPDHRLGLLKHPVDLIIDRIQAIMNH